MELACITVLWSPYSIYSKLKDNFLMQEPIWTDNKINMFLYFPSSRYAQKYIIWLNEMDAKRNNS